MPKELQKSLIPRVRIEPTAANILLATQVGIFAVFWATSSFSAIPTPTQIVDGFAYLWKEENLLNNTIASMSLNIQAILLAAIVSMVLAWASTMEFFRPWIVGFSKTRFLSMIGFTFYVRLLTNSGHQLKLTILVWTISVFYVDSMLGVIASIPREQFNLARVLKKNPWESLYEVVILGQADKALDALRQNVAMGWQMLMYVEAFSREEGGIGTILSNQNKYFHLPEVMAIQILILALGLLQDKILEWVRRAFCPYAYLTTEPRR